MFIPLQTVKITNEWELMMYGLLQVMQVSFFIILSIS